ncbi:hypothetical protein BDW62DRAFT_198604 [Aspergillus aurantiobrunneus]
MTSTTQSPDPWDSTSDTSSTLNMSLSLLPTPLHPESHPLRPNSTSTTSTARTPSPSTNRAHDIDPDLTSLPDLPLPRPPPVLDELKKIFETWEPVDSLFAETQRNLYTGEMMNLFFEAEGALRNGDAGLAEMRTERALEAAVRLEDGPFIERGRYFMDWIREMKMKEEGEGKGGDGDGNQDTQEHMSGDRQGQAEGEGNREPSPNTESGEVLGDFLAEDGFGEDADWEFDFDAANERSGNADEDEPDTQDAQDDQNHEGQYQDENLDDDDYEKEYENDFDPRNRPQTPIPPRSPSPDGDDEEEVEREGKDEEAEEEDETDFSRYDPWHAYTDVEQDSNAYPYYTSDSGNEVHLVTEYEYDAEDEYNGYPETAPDSSSDSDLENNTPLPHKRKRKRAPISSSALKYTHLHRTKNRHRISPNFLLKSRTMSAYPKAWLQVDEHADITDEFPTLFWNAHSPTLLMQEEDQTQDMAWLARYESSPFFPRRAKFTFRKTLSMRSMASREDWEAFQADVVGERLTMGFLRWESERMGMLVREREREKKDGWIGWEGSGFGLGLQ